MQTAGPLQQQQQQEEKQQQQSTAHKKRPPGSTRQQVAPGSKDSVGPQQHAEPTAPLFEGDVSLWGHTQLGSSHEASDMEPEVSELSSGISPRDMRPRLKPFDLQQAAQAFVYESDMFSRAQVLRRDGCAPPAMGLPDDLPTRIAYQQLNVLAGMAGKVQNTILHNKRIFEQRMLCDSRALQRRVLHGWQQLLQQRAAKNAKLARAQGRLQRGVLLRVFFSWKDELHHADKTLAMKRKVAVAVARGCMRRCLKAWQELAAERWWKSQLDSIDSQVVLLEAKLRGYEKRPIQVLRKRRLSQLLSAWLVEALWSRHKRRQMALAARWCRQHKQQQAWAAWRGYVESKVQQRRLEQRLLKACQHIKQQAAWEAWFAAMEHQQLTRRQLKVATQHSQRATCLQVWRAWQASSKQNRSRRTAASHWKRPYMAKAFRFWRWWGQKQKRQRLVLARSMAKRRQHLVQAAFACWTEYVAHRQLKSQLGDKQSLQDELERLKAENARLQRDNERFVRLVDSGEWGRGRVAELSAAGELMRAERDALLKLVQALRREYEAVQLAKESQHDELRALKDKWSVKGSARNCLLVKGGSSFNALVRALKQDLIDTGTAAKDPALLYQIDKLSLDKVQVYPDGELNIQAVATGTQDPQQQQHYQQQQQQHSLAGSPTHARTRSPGVHGSTTNSHAFAAQAGDAAAGGAAIPAAGLGSPQLRVRVGKYSSSGGSPRSSPGGVAAAPFSSSSTMSSPTRLGSVGVCGASLSSSRSLAGGPGSPVHRQQGHRALSAAAAAAAAAAAHRVMHGALAGGSDAAAGAASPTAGQLLQQLKASCLSPMTTEGMLQALSNLTPVQVQRLSAAGQLQQQQQQQPVVAGSRAAAAASEQPAAAAARAVRRSTSSTSSRS